MYVRPATSGLTGSSAAVVQESEAETPMSPSVTGDRYLRDAECRPPIVQGCQAGIFPDKLQQPLPIFGCQLGESDGKRVFTDRGYRDVVETKGGLPVFKM